MKRITTLILGLTFLFLGANRFVMAQDEDLLLDDLLIEEEEDVVCEPDSLMTVYDAVAKDSISNLDIRQKYNFGSEHYKNKNYKSALPYLWTVFIKDTGQFGDNGRRANLAIGKISQVYFEEQKVDSTLIACYRGLARFPDNTRLHYYAAYIQENLGRLHCAIPHYEQLVLSDSTNYSELKAANNQPSKLEATKLSYLNNLKKLAFLYYKDENDKAIDVQKKVVELDPTNADEANTLALYTEHFHGRGAGLEHFKDAYTKNPEDLDLAYRYGRAAVQNGKYQEAIEPLSKYIAQKRDKTTLLLRAEAYENLNQLASAINDYKSILDLEVDNADVMLNISLNYSDLNNFSSANYWINRALRAKPGYGMAYIVRGELYEIAVSYCQDQRGEEKYEDKLVYEKAYAQYERAKRDVAFISKAKTKQRNLQPFLPTTEDKFMHKGDTIESACYDFLK